MVTKIEDDHTPDHNEDKYHKPCTHTVALHEHLKEVARKELLEIRIELLEEQLKLIRESNKYLLIILLLIISASAFGLLTVLQL